MEGGVSVHLITYNVGTFLPGDKTNLADLLPTDKPDIVLVGFQEVNVAPSRLVLETLLLGEDPWSTSTRTQFAKHGYTKIRSIKLLGMVLSFFCLEQHVPYIRGLETQYTRLGFNGYWGNKGCVSVRFSVYGVSVVVLNSHLAPHDHQNQIRVDSYNHILGVHTFTNPQQELIMYHDYVFWMGDLNFRLEQDTFTFQQIELKVSKNEHRDLLIEDQLTKVRETGAAFSELSENLPTFPPSFKYKVGTSVFDPKRRPAWTDRVLFKVNKANFDTLDLNLEQLSYESHPAFLDSDHKPVSAGFKMQVMTPDLADKLLIPCFKPVVKFHTEEIFCGEDNVIVYSVDIKNRRYLKSWDWVGVYRAEDCSIQDHIAFLWAPSDPVRDTTFEIYFDDAVFIRSGLYRLVYYSDESKDILGFSKPIHVRIRDIEPEVGVEATEEL